MRIPFLLLLTVALTAAEADLIALTRNGALAKTAVSALRDDVIALASEGHPPRSGHGFMVMTDGQILMGVPRSMTGASLAFQGDLIGTSDIPVASVSSLTLGSGPMAVFAGPVTSGVVFANSDRLDGRIDFLDERNVGVDTGRKVVPVPRDRIATIVLAPTVGPSAERWMALTRGGDRLAVKANGAALVTVVGQKPLPATAVLALWQESKNIQPLSSAILPGTPGVWRDRYGDGRSLEVLGRACGHGVAVRGGATIELFVPPEARTLVGVVEIQEGTAVPTIATQGGGEGWSGGSLAPGEAKPFSVPLAGAKKVILHAGSEPGEGAPLTVWGWVVFAR